MKARRSIVAMLASLSILVPTGAAHATASSSQLGTNTGTVSPRTAADGTFLELRTDTSALSQWKRVGTQTYAGGIIPNTYGWDGARQIAKISSTQFLELKGDAFNGWNITNKISLFWSGTGWSNVRLITGLDTNSFLAVRYNGGMSKWTWNGGARSYYEHFIGYGWDETQAIAGVSGNGFIELKNRALRSWTIGADDNFSGPQEIADARYDTRAIAGVGTNGLTFVELDGDYLNEWTYGGHYWDVTTVDSGWSHTKTIG